MNLEVSVYEGKFCIFLFAGLGFLHYEEEVYSVFQGVARY